MSKYYLNQVGGFLVYMLNLSVVSDRLSKFFINNASAIYKLVAIVVIVAVFFTFSNKYKNREESLFNQKLFDIVNNNNSDLKLLEDLYNNDKSTVKNRAFAGLVLAKEYIKANMINDAINVYDKIHGTSNDKFIRDFAGYNLFRLSLNLYDQNKILEIYNSLISENNSMMDLVKEQYSLYLLVNNRVDEAKIVLDSIDQNDSNVDLFDRIELYRTAYKF